MRGRRMNLKRCAADDIAAAMVTLCLNPYSWLTASTTKRKSLWTKLCEKLGHKSVTSRHRMLMYNMFHENRRRNGSGHGLKVLFFKLIGRPVISRRRRRKAGRMSNPATKRHCICKMPYFPDISPPMIMCDRCERWYHAICVGQDFDLVKNQPYTCPPCGGVFPSEEHPKENAIVDQFPVHAAENYSVCEIPVPELSSACYSRCHLEGRFFVSMAAESTGVVIIGPEDAQSGSSSDPSLQDIREEPEEPNLWKTSAEGTVDLVTENPVDERIDRSVNDNDGVETTNVAQLSAVAARKILEELQEKLNIDFADRKEQVDHIIKNILKKELIPHLSSK